MSDEMKVVDARESSNQLIVGVVQLWWPDRSNPFNLWFQMWPAVLFGMKWFEGLTPAWRRYWSLMFYLGPFAVSVSRDFWRDF